VNWKELSDTTKALIYLAGVVASAFVGGAIAIGTLRPILDAPEQISVIRDTLEAKIAELEAQIDTVARQNEQLKNLFDENSAKVSSLEEIDLRSHLRSGDRITVQGVSGKYLFDLDSRNRDELDVIMSSAQEWRIKKSN